MLNKSIFALVVLIVISAGCRPAPLEIVEQRQINKGQVLVEDNLLYTTGVGLSIYELENGRKIGNLVGHFDSSGINRDIVKRGDLVFMANRRAGLEIIDVSEPSQPTKLNEPQIGDDAFGVAVFGDFAYVTNGVFLDAEFTGLLVVNISDPEAPQIMRQIPFVDIGTSSPLAIIDHYLLVPEMTRTAGGWDKYLLHVMDLTEPAEPTIVATFSDDDFYWPTDIHVRDRLAYISNSGQGLMVLDLDDPLNPKRIGFLRVPGTHFGMSIDGDFAYMADIFSLKTINISNPKRPFLVSSTEMEQLNEVYSQDGLIYAPDWYGFKILLAPDS